MLVQATKLGYYDLKRRNIGQVFDIEPKLFSDKWMKKMGDVSPTTEPRAVKKQKAEKAPEKDSSDLDVI